MLEEAFQDCCERTLPGGGSNHAFLLVISPDSSFQGAFCPVSLLIYATHSAISNKLRDERIILSLANCILALLDPRDSQA